MPRAKSKATEASPFSNPYIDQTLAIQRLDKDLQEASYKLTDTEARFLVDQFYISQDNRIRFDGQVRSMSKDGEPHMLLTWLGDNESIFEQQIKKALDRYTDEHPIGKWIKSLHGFGPILAAGFIAHIDIEKAPTVGHIWSYAGLNPEVKWKKGEVRPWNADLKKLVFKAGEVQVKFAADEKCYYGRLFLERRAYEWNRNFEAYGREAATKAQALYKTDAEAWAWVNGCYKAADIKRLVLMGESVAAISIKSIKLEPGQGDPMLPPAQIHSRARRFAMKIFLSHLHEVWYEHHFKTRVPKPFVIEHLGHVHKVEVPNYDSPYAKELPSKVFHVLKHKGKDEKAFLEDLDGLEVGERILVDRYSEEVRKYFTEDKVTSFKHLMIGRKSFAERISDEKPTLKH